MSDITKPNSFSVPIGSRRELATSEQVASDIKTCLDDISQAYILIKDRRRRLRALRQRKTRQAPVINQSVQLAQNDMVCEGCGQLDCVCPE